MNTLGTPLAEGHRKAVASWLADSLNRPANAHEQWADCRLAILALGRRFSAFRLADELVYVVAADTNPAIASTVLGTLGGPVIHDPRNGRFYVLVPSSPPGPGFGRYATYLGLGHYIGVPRVGDNEPDGTLGSYWAVPPTAPGALCDPVRVADMVNAGTALLESRSES